MYTEYVYHDTEDHFSDRTSMIAGIATLRLNVDHDDEGTLASATLIEVKVGALTFTADQMAEAFGAKLVDSFERWVADWEVDKE